MNLRYVPLAIQIDGEWVPLVKAQTDGKGVFVIHESDHKKFEEGKTVTWHRIGSLPDEEENEKDPA